MSKLSDLHIEQQESGESHSPKLLTPWDVSDRIEDNKPRAMHFLDVLLGNELIKPHNLKVIDSTSFHSGGGCWHYFFYLSDKRVLTFHHTDDVEISYNKWDSLNDYINGQFVSQNDKDGGFGWEFENPDYKDRQWIFPFEILMMP
tara:strand:- start:180 stop:614 length:435 start_codon:yes stop_codon:yes gene_type:complete